ncbi:hypothetical protein QWY82_08275 [Simiduia curdlanivorans]|uniref:Lipoprotein n=1 Tax=Simiduia curdlanivorans TaxID=1492769 RepID=A0ABV8V6E1_9GAMM|nr:hypothetical protein [Simiduia curdlanivorans]MDN3638801.1 hypothetical protein [Simiduia curdlanivorans]
MRRFSFTLLLILAGCATQNQYTPVTPQTELGQPKLPALQVVNEHPSMAMYQACLAFDTESVMQHCRSNRIGATDMQLALQKSQRFEHHQDSRYSPDYTLHVATAQYLEESMEGLGNAVVSGLSLMLIPMHQAFVLKAEATLRWRGIPLELITIETPFTQSLTLANTTIDPHSQMAEAISAALLEQLEARDAFSVQFLAQKLGTSDYDLALIVPNQVGNYQLDQREWRRHPLQGAWVSYIDKNFQFDQFSLAVYPIKATDWQDIKATLEKEAMALQKDMLLDARQQKHELRFNDLQRLSWSIKGQTLDVYQMSAAHQADTGEALETRIYLFIQEDKVVATSSTLSGDNAPVQAFEAATQQLASTIQVPAESLFMAQLRKEWRETNSNNN